MATEEELEQSRRDAAAALRAAGTQPFPNDFRPSEDDRREREALLAVVDWLIRETANGLQ